MMKRTIAVLTLTALLWGCTEEVSIAPRYTGENNWAPQIELLANNYNRLKLNIRNAPALETLRNIELVSLEIRNSNAANYTAVDSINYLASSSWQDSLYYWLYQPVLVSEQNYDVRIRVGYREGVAQFSNTINLTAPRVPGEILDKIDVNGYRDFAFHDGKFYVFDDNGWANIKMHTVDTTTFARDEFTIDLQSDCATCGSIQSASIVDNEIVLGFRSRHLGELNLVFLDPATLAVLRIVVVQNVYSDEFTLIGGGADELLVSWQDTGFLRLDRVDKNSGGLLSRTENTTPNNGRFGNIFYDGHTFWLNEPGDMDNRIHRLDSSLNITATYVNPVYLPGRARWIGDQLWMLDFSALEPGTSLSRVRLEGL